MGVAKLRGGRREEEVELGKRKKRQQNFFDKLVK